jgi:hypothetical protein
MRQSNVQWFFGLVFLVMTLALPSPTRAQGAPDDALMLDAPPFVLCEKDDECEAIIGICGMWVGVNHGMKDEAIGIFTELNTYRSCTPASYKKPERVGCNAGQCDLRPDKTGCMLYTQDGACEINCLQPTADGFCQKACMRNVDCNKK